MKGMDRAVERIARGFARGKDYRLRRLRRRRRDLDGPSSSFSAEIGRTPPRTYREALRGYGLNPEAVKKLAASGCRLVITVDCGSSNRAEVELANSLGIDVIVTDHHEMPKDAPPALAVLNPGQESCRFPFKGLEGGCRIQPRACAPGISPRDGWFRKATEPQEVLDLVALGTVADLVPLYVTRTAFSCTTASKARGDEEPLGLRPRRGRAQGRQLSASHIALQMAAEAQCRREDIDRGHGAQAPLRPKARKRPRPCGCPRKRTPRARDRGRDPGGGPLHASKGTGTGA
ncbi:MAG: DHH family phosphoesterase [Deltaproteobacteria bacterium]|nr:DHH family phosphoesterase [Deltaproteobacteria bacterium]